VIVDHRFVFVGGLHRSGTTLVADLIAGHPEVTGLSGTDVPMDEGQFLQKVYPPAGTKRTLWPIRYLDPVAPDFLTQRGYGGPGRFGFDPGSWLTEESPLATQENARKVFTAWKPYLDLSRPIVIEKSPPNLVRTRFLQKLFPNSQFVIILRHPVAVSYATRIWTNIRPMYYMFKHWVHCHRVFDQDRAQLHNVMVVHYEHLVSDPERCLSSIYDFLNISYTDPKVKISTDANKKYFSKWNVEMSSSSVRRKYAEFLQKTFSEDFNRYGYDLNIPLDI